MKRYAAEVYGASPYLFIWGIQWMIDSLLQYGWILDPNGSFRNVLVWTAVVLSIVYVFRGFGKSMHPPVRLGARLWIPALAAAVLLLVALQVSRLEMIPLFSAELLRSLALACFYMLIGAFLGRELVYLGLWLLALCVVIAVWYVGYAPIILGFSGGASMIACVLIFRFWHSAALKAKHSN